MSSRRDLYDILYLDLRNGKLNKNFKLSKHFVMIHNHNVNNSGYTNNNNNNKYFEIDADIKATRKDQLLLNLQYNNLINSYNIYDFHEYYQHAEEFFTYFLNYELTTDRWSPSFPQLIENIFSILNKYTISSYKI